MANAQPQYPQVVPGSAMPMAVRRGADPLFPRLPLNSKPKPSALHLGSRQPELAPRALSARVPSTYQPTILSIADPFPPSPPVYDVFFPGEPGRCGRSVPGGGVLRPDHLPNRCIHIPVRVLLPVRQVSRPSCSCTQHSLLMYSSLFTYPDARCSCPCKWCRAVPYTPRRSRWLYSRRMRRSPHPRTPEQAAGFKNFIVVFGDVGFDHRCPMLFTLRS